MTWLNSKKRKNYLIVKKNSFIGSDTCRIQNTDYKYFYYFFQPSLFLWPGHYGWPHHPRSSYPPSTQSFPASPPQHYLQQQQQQQQQHNRPAKVFRPSENMEINPDEEQNKKNPEGLFYL